MTSVRNNPPSDQALGDRPEPTVDSRDVAYLDAARDSILAVGWRRTTLTDVARRAGVSRMTIYRRWPDMQALLGDLLVREWGGLIDDALVIQGVSQGADRDPAAIARGVVVTVAALRDDPLFRRILDVDPELLLPYLLHRRGRNQEHVLDLLAEAVEAGQVAGTVRDGDAGLLARTLLLTLQGFVVSVATMADTPLADIDRELDLLVDRYLRP